MTHAPVNTFEESLLFIKRWIKHPLRLGAIAPSSKSLGRLISRNVAVLEDRFIVELGAGTGTITRRLLEAGVPKDRLFVVELDPELCAFLKRAHPDLNIIQGDASKLAEILPSEVLGKVSTIVSGMPVSTMPFELQRKIIQACFDVLEPSTGEFIQYSYHLHSPLPAKKLEIIAQKIGRTFRNLPPAYLWKYKKQVAA